MPDPLTPERIAEIRQRLEAATPGPWPDDYVYSAIRHIARNCEFESETRQGFEFDKYDDSPFIAHAREDVPALLAEVERLQARVAALEAKIAASVPREVALKAAELAFEDGWDEGSARRTRRETTHSDSREIARLCLESAEAMHADKEPRQ